MMGPAHAAEQTLLRVLSDTWRQLNHSHFGAKLSPPTLTLTDGISPLGQWSTKTRTLSLSRGLIKDQPWGVVVEVLKHEMAHQFVHEEMGLVDQTAHGPAFRDLCSRLGIDAAASGLPTPPATARDKAVGKVQRLLALADSDNVHEAQAALKAAHRLMRKHNLQRDAPTDLGENQFRQVGAIRARFSAHEKILAGILGEHFFVRCIWVPAFSPKTQTEGRVLEICGSSENLDIAEYTHITLLNTSERLWRQHKRDNGITNNRERRRYLSGVMVGFLEKLREEAADCHHEGLVWLGDPKLRDYVSRRHPHLVRSRGPRLEATDTWLHGKAAGQELHLPTPIRDQGRSPRRLTTDYQ